MENQSKAIVELLNNMEIGIFCGYKIRLLNRETLNEREMGEFNSLMRRVSQTEALYNSYVTKVTKKVIPSPSDEDAMDKLSNNLGSLYRRYAELLSDQELEYDMRLLAQNTTPANQVALGEYQLVKMDRNSKRQAM